MNDSGFVTRLLKSAPDLRTLGLATCALLAISFVAGRRIERPITIPKTPESTEEQIPAESSAIRQYAVAMLQPHRSAAWEAVVQNFPDSPEADLAELRLGLTLMSGLVPDNEAALKVFTEVRDKSTLIPEKQYLVLLGMLGRAYALKELEHSVKTTPQRSPRFATLFRVMSKRLNWMKANSNWIWIAHQTSFDDSAIAFWMNSTDAYSSNHGLSTSHRTPKAGASCVS
jgi:hypothetical protein